MKKSGFTAVLAAFVLLAAGCGAGDAPEPENGVQPGTETDAQAGAETEIDAQALAESLVTGIDYDDALEAMEEDVAAMYFTIEDGVKTCLYMGSGSTAEEVAVFEAPDEETARAQLDNAQAYLDSQKEAVQDYQPEEAKRIEDAVLEQNGNYVVLCVSGDSAKAKEIIKEAFR